MGVRRTEAGYRNRLKLLHMIKLNVFVPYIHMVEFEKLMKRKN